jgi:hypothetical protein
MRMHGANLLFTAILLATLAVPVGYGQQFTQIDPSHGPFDLGNSFVHVIHVNIPPHDAISLKASSVESIAVSLHECALKVSSDKGSSEQWAATAGSVMSIRSGTAYSLANQSGTSAELQIAEFLGSYRVDQLRVPYTSYDPVKLDPQRFRTVFENEQLRVLHVSIGPRAETEDAQFSAGVSITLQDSRTIRTWRDGTIRDDQRAAGSVSWEQAGLQSIKNPEDKPVDLLLLELKRPFCYDVDEDVSPDAREWYDKAYWKTGQSWGSFMFFHQPYETKGLITVAFKLQPNGKLNDEGVMVLSAFGNDSMVEAAISAVRKSAPFPPLPRGTNEGVRFTFIANLPKTPPGCK